MKKLFIFLLFIGTAFWGIYFIVTKESFAIMNVYVFLMYKFLLAGISLMLIFPHKLKILSKSNIYKGSILGLILYLSSATQAIGLDVTTASNAGFISGLCVIFVPLIKFVFLKKNITQKVFFATLVSFIGLAVLTLGDDLAFNVGDVWVLICAVGFGLQIIMIGKYTLEEDAMTLTIVHLVVAGLLGLVVTSVQGISLQLTWTYDVWIIILFTALLSTAYMYTVQTYSQQYISEEEVAIIFLFEPIFACIAAAYYLHEPISMRVVAGGFLLLLGLFISEYQWKKRE